MKNAQHVRTKAVTNRTRVVLIESNVLTAWAIKQSLADQYDLVCCSTLEEARTELARADETIVICGSPIIDDHPEAISEIAAVKNRRVLALVSDTNCELPSNVRVLEKPFDLTRLSELLDPWESPAESRPQTKQELLVDRLHTRIKNEVCPVCIHRTADGGCSVRAGSDRSECAAFKWAAELAELVEGMESNRLGDYLDRIQAIICPACKQGPDGRCTMREHLDCPIDLYLGLVVPIVEDEVERLRLARN